MVGVGVGGWGTRHGGQQESGRGLGFGKGLGVVGSKSDDKEMVRLRGSESLEVVGSTLYRVQGVQG